MKISWGLLSTARINDVLLPFFGTSKSSVLTGVASRNAEKAREYARARGIPKSFGTYEELLADPSIDAVYISLPNHLHAHYCEASLRAGKHVLCEKPLALTLDSIRPSVGLANEKKLCFVEAFMYRHHEQSHAIRRLCQEGAIGELQTLSTSFQITFHDPQKATIRLDPKTGGGSLWDLGCYTTNALLQAAAFRRVTRVTAVARFENEVDVSIAGTLRFEDGLLAHFDCGFQGHRSEHLRVLGSKGELFVERPFKPGKRESLRLSTGPSETRFIEVVDPEDFYTKEMLHLERAILEKTEVFPPMRESLQTLLVLEKLNEAARGSGSADITAGEWTSCET